MFCPKCGAPNEDDAAFCGNCGSVLAEVGNPAESPQVTTRLEEAAGAPGETAPEPAPVAELPPPVEEVEILPPPPAYSAPSRLGASLQTSGLAIASLVLGIGGLTFLPLLGSIVGVFLGYAARRDIRSRPGEVGGEGVATVGLVLSWIGIGLTVLGLIIAGGFGLCGICAAFGQGQ